jgi:hypothetical protein
MNWELRNKRAVIPEQSSKADFMKIINLMVLAGLAILLTSCAVPQPAQSFYHADSTALVIKSLENGTGQMVQPTISKWENNDSILARAMALPQRQTAVVILENYTEPQIGEQFRSRGTPLFVGLRHLGYQHIVFVQGAGVASPEGLMTLAEYN